MNKTAPLSFDRGSEQVEAMMQQGMPFACVEDLIDGARLSRRIRRSPHSSLSFENSLTTHKGRH